MRTKPRSSRATHPESQPEVGSAPMKGNSPATSTDLFLATPGEAHGTEELLPLKSDDLGLRQHLNARMAVEPVDEVAKHPTVQIRTSDDHRHLAPLFCQEHCCLSG